jgi:AcrR family transcriptional regulator
MTPDLDDATCLELRADARRNRERIVCAARDLFAERGLNVPLEDIADRAGVGIATLYRRFPTREDLVAATCEAKLTEFAELTEKARDAPDAWAGFCEVVERSCAMQAADRGFTDLLTLILPNATAIERLRRRATTAFAELARRAQEEGRLRADFVPEDFALLLMANAGVVQAGAEAAPHAWRRLVALALESFRPQDGPLPAPPTHAQTSRAMRALGRAKGICPGDEPK